MIDTVQAGSLFLLAVLLFGLERLTPLRPSRHPIARRLLVNAGLSAGALAVATVLVRPVAAWALQQNAGAGRGLVPALQLAGPVQLALSLLLMDLTFYWWHVANHKVPLLWRMHNVHHIDPDLDVSTALRFHFGEVALSVGFRAAQVAAIGVPASTFVLYELLFQANTLVHHSNVRLPIAVERVLNLMLVTPRMHGIHHSQVREETDSNYSVVFSWWDRVHGTLRLDVPQRAITIGVPAYAKTEDNRLGSALLLPFRSQRDYWRGADGAVVGRRATGPGPRSRLAE